MNMANLTTERLLIRPFQENDWNDLLEYLSDEEVVRFEPYGPLSPEQAGKEAADRANDPSFHGVCLRENGKLIGNLYLHQGGYDTWELGYVFNRSYQGRGFATESAKALIGHAFCSLGARRVIAMCNPLNTASWKLLERLHMRREGHLIQNVYFKTTETGEPVWTDTFLYAILKPEWETFGVAGTTANKKAPY